MGCFEKLASCLFAGLYCPCKETSEIHGDIGEVQYHLITINSIIANSVYCFVEALCGKLYFC